MKFRFKAVQGHKVRKGTLEAPDLETAEAMLERKDMEPLVLEILLEERPKGSSYLAIVLCLLGTLIVLMTRPSGVLSTQSFQGDEVKVETLTIEGRLLGVASDADIRLVAAFPELPTKIEAQWADVAQEDGSFVLVTELISAKHPNYFHFTVQRDKKTVFQEKSLEYSLDQGKGSLSRPARIKSERG